MEKRISRLYGRDRSVFLQMLEMLFFTVLIILFFHIVSTRYYEKQLAENYIEKSQQSLQRNVDYVFQKMQQVVAIPKAVESTNAYNYLRVVNDGQLPRKYYSMIRPLKNTLNNLAYLESDNLECLIYFPGANVICTRRRAFPVADQCFTDYILFSETDGDTLLGYLQSKQTKLLPAEMVRIADIEKEMLTLVIDPIETSVSLMVLYGVDELLEGMGYYELPEGTSVNLSMQDGTVLLSRMEQETKKESESRTIEAKSKYLDCKVTFCVPASYFENQLAKSRRLGFLMTALIAGIGFLFCIWISKRHSDPLRELARSSSLKGETNSRNEVVQLAHILNAAETEIRGLSELYSYNVLTKLFSGAVLDVKEQQELRKILPSAEWRIAVLHADRDVYNDLRAHLKEIDEENSFFPALINTQTTGILFPNSASCLDRLGLLLDMLAQRGNASCGVSAPFKDMDSSYIALRQAYLSLSDEKGVSVYTGNAPELATLPWRQHEMLYHAILTGDEHGAADILREITSYDYIGDSAREVFLNVCFVIYSAADELEMPFSEMERVSYDRSMSVQQNMEKLNILAGVVFEKIRHKKKESHGILQEKILRYIMENCSDCQMSAAVVGAAFGISEKQVYTIVRKSEGISFSEYLLKLRMHRAAGLLCTTAESVEKIAQQCGYPVMSTFYRAFGKYFGCAPAQYREGAARTQPEG